VYGSRLSAKPIFNGEWIIKTVIGLKQRETAVYSIRKYAQLVFEIEIMWGLQQWQLCLWLFQQAD
jgi:hypothetical protein